MNKKAIIKKLKDKSDKLKEFGVKKIGLFGSYARDDARWNSDIDLLVTFSEKTFQNYMGLLFQLRYLLKKKIDLVIEEGLKPELRYVKREAEYVRMWGLHKWLIRGD